MRFVLVHSPLVGPLSWARVAAALEERGHAVLVPSLAEATLADGGLWQAQVRAVAEAVRDGGGTDAVWLVGHSGAGPLLPAVGKELSVPVAGYLFVDAALPHPGRSRLEALPAEFRDRLRALVDEGWLPPWNEWFEPGALERLLPDPTLRAAFVADLPRLPWRMFEEVLPDVAGWPESGCGYLQLSDAYEAEASQAAAAGWPLMHRDGHHLWPLTHPREVAAALLTLAGTAASPRPYTPGP